MTNISISESCKSQLPNLCLGILEMNVVVGPSGSELLALVVDKIASIHKEIPLSAISEIPAVKASKESYRLLGKDPSRYRLSADSLLRRVVKGNGLSFVNNVVDLLNYQSISTGYSICGYDAKSINGAVVLSLGEKDEPYVGIGRGNINIENMPVFTDNFGPFGTPTSDSTRTAVGKKTTSFLMIYVSFDGAEKLNAIMDDTKTLYTKYCSATNISTQIIG